MDEEEELQEEETVDLKDDAELVFEKHKGSLSFN